MPQAVTPASMADAMAQLDAAMDYLTSADWTSLPSAAQAEALSGFVRAEARQTAARTAALAAFDAGNGYRLDGHAGPRPWLAHITRVTKPAAADAVRWLRLLGRHPRIAAALSGGAISASYGKEFATWNDRLPAEDRDGADEILIGAVAVGLSFDDIARLAQEMYERSKAVSDDDDGPFRDRRVKLERTFGGVGKLTGDLTQEAAEILQRLFDALGKRLGPDDLRSEEERNHDALLEAGKRLLKADLVPQSSGMDTKAIVHIPLGQLRLLPGASAAEAGWIEARLGQESWLTGTGAEAAACASSLTPVVTGTVDWQALDKLTGVWLAANDMTHREACECTCGGRTCVLAGPLPPETRMRLSRTLLRLAIDAVSGPDGLAAYLRAKTLGAPFSTASMPLDIGYSKDIPEHIRRAVIMRDRCCAWPGCDKPPAACEPHHLVPRSEGGRTELSNLKLLCWYHHHVCVHRIGWQITVNADGTVDARSPWGQILRSHAPPTSRTV